MVCKSSALVDSAKKFSKIVVPIYSHWWCEFQLLHIIGNTWYFCLLKFFLCRILAILNTNSSLFIYFRYYFIIDRNLVHLYLSFSLFCSLSLLSPILMVILFSILLLITFIIFIPFNLVIIF